jgi:hypothetical protein
MPKPFIKYLVSSPYGDIPVDKKKWHLPLEGDALNTPYRVYFQYIEDFLAQEDFRPLLYSINKKFGREIHLKDVKEIIIRSEKHGFLYHPASIEVIFKQDRVNPVRKGQVLNGAGLSNGVKFGLNVAISEVGKNYLREEFSVLKRLNTKSNLSYLPGVYIFSEQNSMSFLLEDWFEGYHEFHISRDEEGKQRIKLWDFHSGYKYLSQEQCFEIYKQCSKILTLYYDLNDFSQIYPWHHAAGDFVVKVKDKKIDVHLTTARRYEPFIGFLEKDTLNPILALCYYLLDLSVRMRLDKLDGMGEVVWADDICLEATLSGFLEALKLKEELKNYIGSVEDFLSLLKAFGEEELKITFNPIIELYTKEKDFPILIENLEEHVKKLYTILQSLPL